jgi:hypothetical protein
VIKALVSIEVDLTASRAIRFACQLGNFIPMEIHPVYVKASPARELAIGAGWARRHWEEELVEQGQREISEMITSEIDYCPVLQPPRVICGDRETELVNVMDQEAFDLFVDGERFEWTPPLLHKKLHSRLLQRYNGPVAMMRVLRRIEKLLVLCLDPPGAQAAAQVFPHLWAGCSLPVALAVPAGAGEALLAEAARAGEAFKAAGCRVEVEENFPHFPTPPDDEFLRQYGLVGVPLKREVKKDSPEINWLCQVKVPLIMALY